MIEDGLRCKEPDTVPIDNCDSKSYQHIIGDGDNFECLYCKPNFALTSATTCEASSVTNCRVLAHSEKDKCEICMDTKILSTDKTACHDKIDNCDEQVNDQCTGCS